jgi:hypothetical protein
VFSSQLRDKTMRNKQQRFVASLLTMTFFGLGLAHAGDSADKCAVKLTEIDAAIEEARKEGSMRKVATLKDLRVEALRCANKAKSE